MARQGSTLNGRFLIVPLLFALVLPASANGRVTGTATWGSSDESVSSLRGGRVYSRACAACHGAAGNGGGPAARHLNPRPRDFTSGTYKFRSTPTGTLPTDEDLYRTVTSGIPMTMMPAFEDLLTERERRDVVAYIKSFSERFRKHSPGKPIDIPREPDATPQSIAEGKSIYIIMACWVCHGARGDGDGTLANSLKDDWGYKIEPFDFTTGSFKGGKDDRSIFRTFDTGLNGTPMPSYAGAFLYGGDSIEDLSGYTETYSQSEIAALKAYLDSQPTQEQLRDMPEAELEKLKNRRKWALVHFVKSLAKTPGIFYRLFVEDTEVTK